nr:hypothetical protein GCM10020093_012270 [Planobispora longispora]
MRTGFFAVSCVRFFAVRTGFFAVSCVRFFAQPRFRPFSASFSGPFSQPFGRPFGRPVERRERPAPDLVPEQERPAGIEPEEHGGARVVPGAGIGLGDEGVAVRPGVHEVVGPHAVHAGDPYPQARGRPRPGVPVRRVPPVGDPDELRADADPHGSRREVAVLARGAPDGRPADPDHAAGDLGGHHVHPGRADEVADELVGGRQEQFGRLARLHDLPVLEDDHLVGEGQGLGLVVGDVDERVAGVAVDLLELAAQRPLQRRIDHGEGLVEQHRRDVGADQPAAHADDLLAARVQPP